MSEATKPLLSDLTLKYFSFSFSDQLFDTTSSDPVH